MGGGDGGGGDFAGAQVVDIDVEVGGVQGGEVRRLARLGDETERKDGQEDGSHSEGSNLFHIKNVLSVKK